MPQFSKKSTAPTPLPPKAYLRVARELEKHAAKLRARCNPQTPQERAALSQALSCLLHDVRDIVRRHHGMTVPEMIRRDWP